MGIAELPLTIPSTRNHLFLQSAFTKAWILLVIAGLLRFLLYNVFNRVCYPFHLNLVRSLKTALSYVQLCPAGSLSSPSQTSSLVHFNVDIIIYLYFGLVWFGTLELSACLQPPNFIFLFYFNIFSL